MTVQQATQSIAKNGYVLTFNDKFSAVIRPQGNDEFQVSFLLYGEGHLPLEIVDGIDNAVRRFNELSYQH